MRAQLTILLLSIISLAQGFYCGNYAYNKGYCLCTDGSWCAPQLYPTVCCDSTKMPSWFSGQWILIDTTDEKNFVDTTRPINITSTSISIPWMTQTPEFPSLITWLGTEIIVDNQDPLHAIAKGQRTVTNYPDNLYFQLDMSLDPNPPANITLWYQWVKYSDWLYSGTITLAPYSKMEEGTTRDFLSVYE